MWTYETLWGDICGGQTARNLVVVNDQPFGPVDLIQALCGTETGGTSTDNKDVDIDLLACTCGEWRSVSV